MKKLIIIITQILFIVTASAQTSTEPAGSGTVGDPYQIANLDNLYWLSRNDTHFNKSYIQTVDIDASATSDWYGGEGFLPIGNTVTKFTGSYDGQGHIISNLTINRVGFNYCGFFGNTDGAVIKNLGLVNCNITGGILTGAIVGATENETTVDNCFSTGTITGGNQVGGLVGINYLNSSISNCYSQASVTGTNKVGGLVGTNENNSSIKFSYSSGIVTGNSDKGGLVGTVVNNSSTENSFWDTETSGITGSAGGTGKTNLEMITYSTYISAGWDFMDETDNGNSDLWGINPSENNSYPFLKWQGYTNNTVAGLYISTQGVSEVTAILATGSGTIDVLGPSDIIQHGFCWSVTENPTINDNKTEEGSRSATGAFTSNITGLQAETTYYLRAYATDSDGTKYGRQFQFTTLALSISTQAVSDITETSVSGNGTIDVLGSGDIIQHGFCWGTSQSPTINDDKTDEGSRSATGVFTSNITGLQKGTTYYLRAYATDSDGTKYGEQVQFTTVGLKISTQAVSDITKTSVSGNGTINVLGSGDIIQHGFCWGTSQSPTINDNKTEEGSRPATGAFTSNITGLQGGNTYYLRAYAIDFEGTKYGEQVSFTIFNESGTITDPYQISTLENLRFISEYSQYWDKHFIQTADIDVSATSEWDGGKGFSPIGNTTTNFSGSYDGGGYKISNLFINRPSDGISVGLFGDISGATIKNIGVENCNIYGADNSGGLVGWMTSSPGRSSNINNCYVTGTVQGNNNVGGLIGYYGGSSITKCYTDINVTGQNIIGGLIGFGNNITVSQCFSKGVVSGSSTVGGIAGYSIGETFTNCYSTCLINGNNYTGGVFGTCYESFINNCFWDTESSGIAISHGGTGKTAAEMKDLATYINAGWDFMGETTNGSNNIWGINASVNSGYPFLKWQGYSHLSDITVSTENVSNIFKNNAYASGELRISGQQNIEQYGFCWSTSENPTITDDKTEEGTINSTLVYNSELSGLTGNTTYYVRAYVTTSGTTTYGNQLFFTTLKLDGEGSESDPFTITSLSDLEYLSKTSSLWNKYFIQTADIDAAETSGWDGGKGFSPIGNTDTKFTGSYDAKEFKINNLFINRPSDGISVGLFGEVNNGTIKNTGIENCNIYGSTGTGALIGLAEGTTNINNCCVTGTVRGDEQVGGLIGYNKSSSVISKSFSDITVTGYDATSGFAGINEGTINQCFSKGVVNGTWSVGGIVGYNEGSINNCYSTCTINGDDTNGGLLGTNNNGVINNCFSTGAVSGNSDNGGFVGTSNSAPSNSFWDTESSGIATSSGGTGKTTAEMKTLNAFTGWDFLGESTNGTDEIWGIGFGRNNGYPYLRWQYPNSAPSISGIETVVLEYTEGDAAIIVTDSINIADDAGLTEASVSVGNYQSGEDVIGYSLSGGITGSFDENNGTITFTGNASVADYISTLASVTYSNSSQTPTEGIRTFSFTVNDLEFVSNTVARSVKVNAINPPSEAPANLIFSSLSGTSFSGSFTGSATATNYLVVRRETRWPDFVPVDGTEYTPGQQGENVIVSVGTSTEFTETNMETGKNYSYRVYAFNANGSNTEYLTSRFLKGKNRLNAGTTNVVVDLPETDDPVSSSFPDAGITISFPQGSRGTRLQVTKSNNNPAANVGGIPGIKGVKPLYFVIHSSNNQPGDYSIVIDFSSLNLNDWNNFKVLKRSDANSPWQNVEEAPLNAVIADRSTDGIDGKFTITGLSSFSEFAVGEAVTVSTPTTTNIPSITVNKGAGNTVLTLTDYFDDAEDGPSGLTYSIESNSNVSLFSSVVLSGTTLTLDYTSHGYGNSNITIRATDQSSDYIETTFSVTVNYVNDLPTGGNVAVTINEDTDKTFAVSDFTFSDPNNDTFRGIKVTALQTKGKLKYNGTEIIINQRITDVTKLVYTPVENENGNVYDTFMFKVSDGSSYSSQQYNMTINVDSVNDAPTLSGAIDTTLTYVEDNDAVQLSGTISITDIDDVNIDSAKIAITGNYKSGEDVLSFTSVEGITGSWNSDKGIIKLTGTSTAAKYQSVLRSVLYQNISNTPSTLKRTITFVVGDGDTVSNKYETELNPISINDKPEIATIIKDIQLNEDESTVINAENYRKNISDLDNDVAELELKLIYQGDNFILTKVTTGERLAPKENWYGRDSVKLLVTDKIDTLNSYIFIEVKPVNDIPEFKDIPDSISIGSDSVFTLCIWDYCEDAETKTKNLKFEFIQNEEDIKIDFNKETGEVKISAEQNWQGKTEIKIKVTDEAGEYAEKQIIIIVKKKITGINQINSEIPLDYVVYQNYPNPFNPDTKIKFGIPEESYVVVQIFSITGERVTELVNDELTSGFYELYWRSENLASGIYFYRVVAQSQNSKKRLIETRKMILLK